MPDRPAPIPDAGLEAFCADADELDDVTMPGRKFTIKFMRRLAGEVLALRAWARGACAWLECASTGAVVDLPATNVPQTAAEGRALLPEHDLQPR